MGVVEFEPNQVMGTRILITVEYEYSHVIPLNNRSFRTEDRYVSDLSVS